MPNAAKNKIKYGLKNVYYAVATVENGSYTYGTPVAIPGAVNLSLSAEGESSPFYADDTVYFRSVNNNGYSGDLEMAIIPDAFKVACLGEVLDNKNVQYELSTIADTPHFALLFEFQGDQHAIRHVLYNCTASRPSVEGATKEDSISPTTETLTITVDPRPDGLVKARTTADIDSTTYGTWYTTVYVPTLSGATNP